MFTLCLNVLLRWTRNCRDFEPRWASEPRGRLYHTQIPTSQPRVLVSGELAGEVGALRNQDFNDSCRKSCVCSAEEPVTWQENLNIAWTVWLLEEPPQPEWLPQKGEHSPLKLLILGGEERYMGGGGVEILMRTIWHRSLMLYPGCLSESPGSYIQTESPRVGSSPCYFLKAL